LSKLQVNSRLIFLLCLAGIIAQITEKYSAASIKGMCYNIYIPIEYCIFFLFFKTSFFAKRGRKIFNVLAVTGLLIAIYFIVFIGIRHRFLSEWVCFNNIIYTACVLLLLLDIYEDDAVFLNQKMPLFWYLLGIFFYTSCTILIFGFWDQIMTALTNKSIILLFSVNSIFNIFMYIAFAIGILLDISDNLKMNKKN
jgi:hypothetical protein